MDTRRRALDKRVGAVASTPDGTLPQTRPDALGPRAGSRRGARFAGRLSGGLPGRVAPAPPDRISSSTRRLRRTRVVVQ